ncbi:MerC domain-containing protein [Polaribacter sp. WD7]|uniref:MerC domain-containing protein n=1 Tax=Polaribacter sp. WD7 TaxID=2269061 RepID=UPI000DF34C34|nr:MerC domain-containing protein [Polaribacter sp. WD7]
MISIHKKKPDNLGIIASLLCFIHCLATPLLFVLQATTFNVSNSVSFWWQSFDLIFLIVGLIAIYHSSKTTSKMLMKYLLWFFWFFLFFLVVNEKIHFFHIPEFIMYTTTLSLSALHFLNLRYCKCKDDSCCASNH